MSNPEETLTTEEKEALERLGTAAQKDDVPDNWRKYAYIGDFQINNAFTLAPVEHVNPKASMRKFHDDLDRPTLSIDAKTKAEFNEFIDEEQGGALAYQADGQIVIPKYELGTELKEDISGISSVQTQFINGDTIAELAILAHEGYAHALHNRQNSGKNDTPYMAAVHSDMTEKIACFEEHLTYAQIYTNLKNDGAERIAINGKEIPIDQILDVYPKLKEEVMKNGFDVQDSACRERIAKISTEYWDDKRAEPYVVQAQKHAQAAQSYPMMGAIVNAREWEQRKKLMVQHLRVPGNAQEFDAPECLKYFEPSPERIAEITKGYPSLSNEQLIALDNYMNKRGLKTNEEKEVFLVENMAKIARRDPEADKDFEKFLLKNSSADNQKISYADGLSLAYHNDGTATIHQPGREDVKVQASLLTGGDYGHLSQATEHQKTAVALKEQKGEYPPECAKTDAHTLEMAAQFNAYVACGDKKKQRKQDKSAKVTELAVQHIDPQIVARQQQER